MIDTINFSALRVFSTCPKLYQEQFLLKTYEPPEKDYFVYGTIVDLILSGNKKDIAKRFILMERKADSSKALEYDEKLKALEAEISTPDKSGATLLEKAKAGNKTAQKGVEKRRREIDELQKKVRALKDIGTKVQVTPAIWDNAHETAEAIAQNPFYKSLDVKPGTSQPRLTAGRRTGTLDYLKFSDPIQKIWALFITGNISEAELKRQIETIPDEEKHGMIVDYKTTFQLSKLDPVMYAPQLWYYREIVKDLTGIECSCFTIVGDKDPDHKRVQDFHYSKATLEEAGMKVRFIEKFFWQCVGIDAWPSAKQLDGFKQTCFRCSECSNRPFSFDAPATV